MAACAHGAGYESCPPANVSHEFNQADKGTGKIHGNKGTKRKHGLRHEAHKYHHS